VLTETLLRTPVWNLWILLFFWVLAPCRLVRRCQCFGETYCPSSGLKWRCWKWRDLYRVKEREFWGSEAIRDEEWWRQYVSPKRRHLPTSLHGAKIPEQQHYPHRRENLKTYKFIVRNLGRDIEQENGSILTNISKMFSLVGRDLFSSLTSRRVSLFSPAM
jgi:hypothetical protein